MVFGELSVGTQFIFGNVKSNRRAYRQNRGYYDEEVDIPLFWRKVSGNLAVCITNIGYMQFDYPHTQSGTNRYMRNHGHRLFFLSSLYRYLNSADANWASVAEGDARPAYANEKGFLSCFSEKERSLIQPHDMTVAVPTGYQKQYGESLTRSVYVGIPSLKQVSDWIEDDACGFRSGELTGWVSDADTMCKACYNRRESRVPGDDRQSMMPVIALKNDAPVGQNENGFWIISIPETPFMGDIDVFLGLEQSCA